MCNLSNYLENLGIGHMINNMLVSYQSFILHIFSIEDDLSNLLDNGHAPLSFLQ